MKSKLEGKFNDVKEAYLSGDKIEDIASKYSVHTQTIRNVLKKCGIRADRKTKINSFPKEEIKLKYNSGKPAIAIAKEYNTSETMIFNILRDCGVSTRNAKDYLTKILTSQQIDEIEARWKNHESTEDLAKEYQIPRYKISQYLKQRGHLLTKRSKRIPKKTEQGYVYIWIDSDDFYFSMAHKDTTRKSGSYVLEHRYNMAKLLGRCLTQEETVHHINGNRSDNRIENLELWTGNHPKGSRVKDLLIWAKEIIEKYKSIN